MSKKNNLQQKITAFFYNLYQTITFIVILVLFLCKRITNRILKLKIFSKKTQERLLNFNNNFYNKIFSFFDFKRKDTISRIDLIELSMRNMETKKARTFITIGGMTIGIGTIVFLVSIGYGLQELVVNRVARLEEMQQTDVMPQAGGTMKINDKTLNNFKEITNVEEVLPLIAVVGKVNYQNSVSDVVAYGVTTNYLQQSALKPIHGKLFLSNELITELGKTIENDSIIINDDSNKIRDVTYSIDQSNWIKVREEASTGAKILGYTKKVTETASGEEVLGEKYYLNKTNAKEVSNKWIKTSVLLWKKEACDVQKNGDCEEGQYVVLRDEKGKQVQTKAYFSEIGLTVQDKENIAENSKKTEDEISSDKLVVNENSDGWVEISSESDEDNVSNVKTVSLSSSAKKLAVVNKAMLKILGINEAEAVGEKFDVSFVVVGDLLETAEEKVESLPTEYMIIAVIANDEAPVFYVPFVDLRSLGITNYSQTKIVVKNQNDLPKTRRQIEAMGYTTKSVSDTVAQINSLFASARLILMLLGMVALSVAALGMFNTLTVSLLERIREVGLMKAMGMKASEIRELFLTESMIMGFFGGIFGILFGFLTGKLLGLLLSLFTIFSGVGYIDISYIPMGFLLMVVILSFLVGILTGIYPAMRATKISALQALRYE